MGWTEKVYDDDVITLTLESAAADEQYLNYTFCTQDPDSNLQELFASIAYDVAQSLADNHVVMTETCYSCVKAPKKRTFRKDKSAKFKENGLLAATKSRINDSKMDGVWVADVKWNGNKICCTSSEYCDKKTLCVLQNHINMLILADMDMTYRTGDGRSGMSITVFPDNFVENGENADALISKYCMRQDYMAKFDAEIMIPRSYIEINSALISECELVEKLKSIVIKHGKTLEVMRCSSDKIIVPYENPHAKRWNLGGKQDEILSDWYGYNA